MQSRENSDFRDYYTIIKKIGDSTFGQVYEVTQNDSNEKRAIKVISKKLIKDSIKNACFIEPDEKQIKPYIDCLLKEIEYMKLAEGENKDNENAVKYYEYFNTDKEFAIVMELCDDNLLTYLQNIKEEEKYDIINQLNKAIKILVDSNFPYIDLRLENILIKFGNEDNSKYTIKLKLTDDIGLKEERQKLCISIGNNENNNLLEAPEILKGEKYNEKSDLWSLGVIIYVLYFNCYPYKGTSIYEILDKIEYGNRDLLESGNSDLDDLIRKLLVEEPERRITWTEYFNHPFFKRNVNKISFEKEKQENFREFYDIIGGKIAEVEFATIYKVRHKETKELRAAKVFDKRKIGKFIKGRTLRKSTIQDIKPYIEGFYNEINHMKILQVDENENINTVHLYEIFENDDELASVMELCDDNLLNIFSKEQNPFNSKKILNILKQLNHSFKVMNKNNLAHRALNLENILIKYTNEEKTDYIVKLKITNDSCSIFDIPKINRINNTLNFIAPEILRKNDYNEQNDLWSLGVIIYALYFKQYPFNGENESEILKTINNGLSFPKKIDDQNLEDLITNLLIEEPEKRLTWEQYFKHSFFKESNYRNIYEIEEDSIGHSRLANVYRCRHIKSNKLMTIKIYDFLKIKDEIRRKYIREPNEENMRPYYNAIHNEINNMKLLEGKNRRNISAIKVYDYFESENEFALVYDYSDENLLSLFSKKKLPFTPKKINEILTLLNISFRIMSENRLVHRALNLENIMVKYEDSQQSRYIVKLKLTEDSGILKDESGTLKKKRINGDKRFVAPEILKGEEYNQECDLWSLGVIIYVLAFKEYPFTAENENQLIKQIHSFIPKNTGNSDLDNLIKGLLIENPRERMTWNDYFSHSFFVERSQTDFRNYYDVEISKEKKLGGLDFISVYKVKEKGTNELRAIEIFDKNKIRRDFKKANIKEIKEEEMSTYIEGFNNEYNFMKMIEGRKGENNNIVKCYEFFNTEDEFAIVMEICDNNLLRHFTERNKSFNSKEIYYILSQLNNSFLSMVENKILHRVLNPENILIKYKNKEKTKFCVKLKLTSDCCSLKDLEKIDKFNLKNANLTYIAPEILKKEDYDEKCDLWSLGLIIYVLTFKEHPFIGDNEDEILDCINDGIDSLKKTDNEELNDLIQGLLVIDPLNRISWNDYFNHPFFQKD